MARLGDWLDERSGWRAFMRQALDEPVPGGARWAYVWGSLLVFVLIVQAVTGVVLASCYSPSTGAAWASVAYVQDQMALGWLVRGLHSAGASAMVALLGLHLLQTAIWGAYRKPRELNWIVGVLMLGLTLGFALTGYLLPWDQKGYWATQVATSLVGATPLVGHPLETLLQGGDAYGNLTLTHFFALHTFVLPGALVGLVGLHVLLFRRHGVTPGWRLSDEELARRAVPFWPDQLARDLCAIVILLGILLASVVATHGADLEAPADPTAAYDARPEWYFLPLFQLLKLFPGRAEVPAALGAPLVVLGALLALPFLDQGPDRSPRRRWKFVAVPLVILAGAIALGLWARHADARSPSYQAEREKARHEAERARQLALAGVPPSGGVAVYDNDPDNAARKLFAARCAGCHVLDGAGENRAPTLDGWASRAYTTALLADPDGAAFYGKTDVHGMKPLARPPEDLRALAEYLAQLGGTGGSSVDAALAERGKSLFSDENCDMCHETDGTSESAGGPNLGGWGSERWLADFLREPGDARFYGKRNKMPRFGDKLTADELAALARLVAARARR